MQTTNRFIEYDITHYMSEILIAIITIIYLLGVPLGVVWLSRRWSFINRISPMMVLYCIGLIIGNVGILNNSAINICNWVGNISVPIAIPLMLMSCNFGKWSTKIATKAFATGLASVVIFIVIGYFVFEPLALAANVSNNDFAKISAAMAGIYTGGIPNIGPISQSVGLPNNLYLLVTSYDLIATGIYLLFVIFLGKRVVRYFLPKHIFVSQNSNTQHYDYNNHKALFGKQRWFESVVAIAVAVAIAAVAYCISLLIPLGNSTAVLVLALTSLSLCISFCKPLHKIEHSFELGLYCVYVFCFSIANMVNIKDINLIDNIFILYYIFFAIFGSVFLQILFGKIFKIDGDTVLVSSISLINSPPFVPLVAATLGNKDVVLTGIGVGLMGYAIANYLGLGIYHLLASIGL